MRLGRHALILCRIEHVHKVATFCESKPRHSIQQLALALAQSADEPVALCPQAVAHLHEAIVLSHQMVDVGPRSGSLFGHPLHCTLSVVLLPRWQVGDICQERRLLCPTDLLHFGGHRMQCCLHLPRDMLLRCKSCQQNSNSRRTLLGKSWHQRHWLLLPLRRKRLLHVSLSKAQTWQGFRCACVCMCG